MVFDGGVLLDDRPRSSVSTAAPAAVSAPSAGAVSAVPGAKPLRKARFSLTVERLPFVGVRGDGQKSFWVMPGLEERESMQLRARTYAAWFLIYAEINGPEAGQSLMDRIEREMPSRYPAVDRIFLDEVLGKR